MSSLGEARFPSPVPHAVSDQAQIAAVIVRNPAAPNRDEVLLGLAGPRCEVVLGPGRAPVA